MPRLTKKLPSYRHHKASGQAIVTLGGRDHYCGPYGSKESRAEYDRLISEWLARHRTSAPPPSSLGGDPSSDITINEVLKAFWRHAEQHYRTPAGEPSNELKNFKDTILPLTNLYGEKMAREFSPLKLKSLRRSMVESGLCRNTVNQRIGRIVHIFKWAASEELIPVSVHQALKTVSGLQKGRTDAKESEPVRPVPEASVEAIRPHVAPQVGAMIELQRLTGMRPGEVVNMRSVDLDMTGDVWVYTPNSHKMLYRGRERKIGIGPAGQLILKQWLKIGLTAFLFSPREARESRFAAMRERRKTRVQPSQQDRKKAKPKRPLGERYTTRTYYHAILYGCARAFPHPEISKIKRKDRTPEQVAELKRWDREHAWHPNQLRHSAATRFRREFGLDVARTLLGHSSPVVTEIYAEQDQSKAIAAMGQIG